MQDNSQTDSPNESSNTLIISLIVDAHRCRDVVVADVLAASLNANMNDYTLLKFTVESVDILC